MGDRLYTTKEIAEIYNVSAWTVSQVWVKKQGLRCKRGRPNRFKLKWVDDFIEQQALKDTELCEFPEKNYMSKGRIKNQRLIKHNNLKINLTDIMF